MTGFTLQRDIRAVFLYGSRRATRHLAFRIRPNSVGDIRLVVTVSARFGGAVARNRIRRRVWEAMRVSAAGVKTGLDVAVSPRPGVWHVPFGVLRAEAQAVLAAAEMQASSAGDRPC